MSQQQVGLHQQTCCRVYRGYAHWEFPLKHYFLQILCRKRPFGVIYSLQNGKTLTRLPQLARLQVGLQSLGNILLYVLKFGHEELTIYDFTILRFKLRAALIMHYDVLMSVVE